MPNVLHTGITHPCMDNCIDHGTSEPPTAATPTTPKKYTAVLLHGARLPSTPLSPALRSAVPPSSRIPAAQACCSATKNTLKKK